MTDLPPQYKSLQKMWAVAQQFEARKDMVTTYWVRIDSAHKLTYIKIY